MIACRSLIRFHTFPRLTYNCVPSNPPNLLNGCSIFQRNLICSFLVRGGKGSSLVMEQKRQKGVTYEWRSVSFQASSSAAEEDTSKEMKTGVRNSHVWYPTDKQVQENDVSKLHIEDIEIQVESESEGQMVSSPILVQGSDTGRNCPGDSVTKKHSISMEVGASLMRFIKGKGGATQREIEDHLEVKLLFPSSRSEDSIIIEGHSAENVATASERLRTIIDEAVESPNLDYSHFVSLPLATHPELVEKLFNFQNSILGTTKHDQDENFESGSKLSELGIEKSIFIKPRTFHLTVLMLKLWNKQRVKAATEVLHSISSQVMDVLEGRPVFIRLKGLQSMRGSLAKARILYAPVEEVGDEDRLIRACGVITSAFVEAGLVLKKDERQNLLLHATIMNARHRKRKDRTRKVDSFDARGIMEQYGSEEWGEYRMREAHLSQRFVFDERGYYHCCASIPFPEGK